jgi:ribonuclease T2
MAVKPEAYFARSNWLFYRLRFPDMATLAREPLSAVDVARAFAAANQGLKSEMIRLNLDGEGWLREVWLCLDIRFRYRKCEGAPLSRWPVHIRTVG